MPPFLARGFGNSNVLRGGHFGNARARGRGRAGLRLRRLVVNPNGAAEPDQNPVEVPGRGNIAAGIRHRIMLRYVGRVHQDGRGGLRLDVRGSPIGDSEQADPTETLQAEHVSLPVSVPHPEVSPEESVALGQDDVAPMDPLALPEVAQQNPEPPYSSTSESGDELPLSDWPLLTFSSSSSDSSPSCDFAISVDSSEGSDVEI